MPLANKPSKLATQPVPAKPVSAAAQALAAPPDGSLDWSNEPLDFSDLELPPDDWSEPDFAPRAAPRPVAVAPRAAAVASGDEIAAIRGELENRKQHLLVTALEEAQLHYSPSVLRVTMANDDAWAKRLREATTTFRDVGLHLFGQPLRVELSFNQQVVSLISEAAQTRASAHEQAKQNPAVRMLLDKFKGEIVHVRVQTTGGNA